MQCTSSVPSCPNTIHCKTLKQSQILCMVLLEVFSVDFWLVEKKKKREKCPESVIKGPPNVQACQNLIEL